MTEAPAAEPTSVTLVIPARDAEATLAACLDAALPLLGRDGLRDIVVVDDGSADATPHVAARYPVECLRGDGRGPGAARNLGWRHARTPLVWFVDADCVAEPEALARLRRLLADPAVAGAGGSYANARPDALLARLIHEEIAERHRRSPREVDFLATFNVLYRRSALAALGGFDERYRRAQDMELAYRMVERGYALRFEPASRVAHFHEHRLGAYLRTQARQGFWRVAVYRDHAGRMRGDSYSGPLDHVQPPLALGLAGLLPLAPWPWGAALVAALAAALVGTALPMTARLLRNTRRAETLLFALLAPLRAFARGAGLAAGALAGGPGARPPLPAARDPLR